MKNSGNSQIDVKQLLGLFITVFFTVLMLLFFSLWQMNANLSKQSHEQLIQSMLNVAKGPIASRDEVGIQRVLDAYNENGRYFKLILPGNFEIISPREFFNPIWQKSPSFEAKFNVGAEQQLSIQYWSPLDQSKQKSFLIVVMGFLFCLAIFSLVGLALFFRRWNSDVAILDSYLSNQFNLTHSQFHFSFFRVLADQIHHKDEEVKRRNDDLRRTETLQKIADLASQVAHDIRSPLSALNLVASTLVDVPEEKRLLIRNASARINDIANSLLQKRKDAVTTESHTPKRGREQQVVMISALIDSIISEKRIEIRDRIKISLEADLKDSYGLFSIASWSDLSRIISNLINNSIEALYENSGQVLVTVRPAAGKNQMIEILIVDNGKGIPKELLETIGQKGITLGKEGTKSGSGLGVYQAKQILADLGGSLKISSEFGKGTSVTLYLPSCTAPSWFIDRISLSESDYLVSVDDDQTIHQIWDSRLKSIGGASASINHLSFSSMQQFAIWQKSVKNHKKIWFLIDYEFLGQQGNGLDLIEKLKIQENSILVSSRVEEEQIQAKAMLLGLKMLPKNLAPLIPISI
jgi:signal transduction histidine kinase